MTSTNGRIRVEFSMRWYMRLPSLQQYVLVSHRKPLVDVWTRTGDAWNLATAGEDQTAELESIRAKVNVRELYEAVAEPKA